MKQGNYQTGNQEVLLVISLALIAIGSVLLIDEVNFVSITGLFMVIVPIMLILVPWVILKSVAWLSRKVEHDKSKIDFSHFADPQKEAKIINYKKKDGE